MNIKNTTDVKNIPCFQIAKTTLKSSNIYTALKYLITFNENKYKYFQQKQKRHINVP